MTLVEIITIGIYIVVYAIVFFIQKSQFDKQKSIMEKYEKMFSIINIDELEKYVNLKEKNLKLELEVREKEFEKLEKALSTNLETSAVLLEELKTLVDERDIFKLKYEHMNKVFTTKLEVDENIFKLFEEEFDEIYNFSSNNLESIDKVKLEKDLYTIKQQYLIKKLDLQKGYIAI